MALHRLLGFRTAVPDVSAVASFYDELGLVGDPVAGYAGTSGGATVQLDEGAFRRPLSVWIGCDDEGDLDAAARRLGDAGATVHRHGDEVRVVERATRVEFGLRVASRQEPDVRAEPVEPNAPGRDTRLDRRAPAVFEGPRPPRRLGHLVLGSPDLAATRDLLVDGLGLKVSDELPGIIAFLRCSTDHHNVALVDAPVPLLQHYSWECDDVDHVGHSATALLRADPTRHAWGLGRHFAGSNFYWYLRDPSGAFVELYADMDQIHDDDAWEASGRTPFDLGHIANSWGPEIPLEFVVPSDLDALQQAWAGVR
ncbi:MAG: VOC family protein [Acidimicrobiales bacterium]|jgi:catechol 2,3-dioxygenase-like lactoylglutathione lyase family enzyme|nr:VOC family protein [Acidimicrobiales bacterium]